MSANGGGSAMAMPLLGQLGAFGSRPAAGRGSPGGPWESDRQQATNPQLHVDFPSHEQLLSTSGFPGLLPPMTLEPPNMPAGLDGLTQAELEAALHFATGPAPRISAGGLRGLLPSTLPPDFFGPGRVGEGMEDGDEVEILSPEELEMESLTHEDLEALSKTLPAGDMSHLYGSQCFNAFLGATSSSSSKGSSQPGGMLGPGGLLGPTMAMPRLNPSAVPDLQPTSSPATSSQAVPPLNLGSVGLQASGSTAPQVPMRFDGPAATKGPEDPTRHPDLRANFTDIESEEFSPGDAGDFMSPGATGDRDRHGGGDFHQFSSEPTVDQDLGPDDFDRQSQLHIDPDLESRMTEEEEDAPWLPPSSLLKRAYDDETDCDEEDLRNHYVADRGTDDARARTIALHELVFPSQSYLCPDDTGEPRGACLECGGCESLVDTEDHEGPLVRWWPEPSGGEPIARTSELPCRRCGCAREVHKRLTPWMEELSTTVDRLRAMPSEGKPKPISGSMLMAKRLRVRPARTIMRMPAVAPHWDTLDAAFFVVTEGAYDPRIDGRGQSRASTASPAAACADPSSVFVSVICPTSDSRHAFHPLLYANFARQTHERRELIVVDTGRKPSAFFVEMVEQDPRIVYKFFPCSDPSEDGEETARASDEHGGPAGLRDGRRPGAGRRRSAGGMPGRSRRSEQEVRFRRSSYEDRFRRELARSPRKSHSSCWSLGLKRNLACHLARGSVIAHFDDDDLYATGYLTCMLRNLLQRGCKPSRRGAFSRRADSALAGGRESPGAVGGGSSSSSSSPPTLGPALATLSEWHLLDLADQTFGFLSPQLDPLIPESARESLVLGYGFSYVYTRSAWEQCPFLDVDWCEDGEFVSELRRQEAPLVLVRSNPKLCAHPGGLAAHCYHRYTTSGGEFAGFMRLGQPVPVPDEFKEFIPLLKQLAHVTGSRTSECHWLRRELRDQALIRCTPIELGLGKKGEEQEVGLSAKDKLIRRGLLIMRRMDEDETCTGPPGPLRSFPAGGFHLRTAPPSRVLRAESAAGRLREETGWQVSAKAPAPSRYMQLGVGGGLAGVDQSQLYTQEVD